MGWPGFWQLPTWSVCRLSACETPLWMGHRSAIYLHLFARTGAQSGITCGVAINQHVCPVVSVCMEYTTVAVASGSCAISTAA
jgi:hypothetical protein